MDPRDWAAGYDGSDEVDSLATEDCPNPCDSDSFPSSSPWHAISIPLARLSYSWPAEAGGMTCFTSVAGNMATR
jgi:hypothetical protein